MTTKRNVYLDMKTIDEARKILFDRFPGQPSMPLEELSPIEAVGRVLGEPAMAALSSPNFHASAMDGIAVDAAKTFGASEDSPRKLIIGSDAFWINTGHVMPEGTNAVIMIERVNTLDSSTVEIEAPAFPWQYVRKMGEDIVATELLFPRGHCVSPYSVGALLSGGVFSVMVRKKPSVLIIPTGSELTTWQEAREHGLKPGDVVESNSWVLGGLCEKYGATFERHPLVRDNLETITRTVKEAAESGIDMVLIIGGSSAGSKDFAKPVIQSLGEVYVHGVTMMPGKPVLFGKIASTPVFGIPGYPVAAIVAFEQFAGPLLLAMQGLHLREREKAMVTPARKIASKLGQEEFLRVKIGSVGDRLMASQLPRGSGNITSLTEADGIVRIPTHVEGIAPDESVEAELIRPLEAIRNTVVIIGSHDNTLDILADQIRRTSGSVSISSSHVGSMGGLMAIKKGACHMAGSHLLNPDDGSYNISYINRYLPDTPLRVVNLVMRDQGLILPKGNPEAVRGLEDLSREGLVFINRQPGSGTRILLDYKLKELGITPGQIAGYDNEEYTHMSVAVAVLSGRADAGLGIHAAARALDLDFLPVVTEQYDLVIPEAHFHSHSVQSILETIRTEEFKQRVESLGGYGTAKTGTIVYSC